MRKTQPKTIAIDIDNVLADTNGIFCKKWSEKWHVSITPDMIKYAKIIGSFRADPVEIMGVQQGVWDDWESLPLIESDASVTIEKLRSAGNKIEIATSRSASSITQVHFWLKKHKIPFDSFKQFEAKESKAESTADILVDDDQETIFKFVEKASSPRIGLLYDRNWNRGILPSEGVIRINGLKEIQSYL